MMQCQCVSDFLRAALDMGPNTSLTRQGGCLWHMWCLRCIFGIPYTDHETNATVRLQAVSPPQLSQLIQARRLRFLDKWQGWIHHLTSLEHSKCQSRAAQGLETSNRTSLSYLAMHPGSRSPTS